MARFGPQDDAITLRFGGGINSRASEDEINPRECATGQNFQLDLDNRTFRNRKPFDLVFTAPNEGQINGFISLLKTDGTVAMAVQAGDTVYEWDGTTASQIFHPVSTDARLRGRLEHNFQLDDKVIVTDVALQDPVYEWDGTTFQATTFLSSPSGTFGQFKAKYCAVQNERAFFGHIGGTGAGGTFEHMIVGSKRGEFETISSTVRASAASTTDPFFLLQPDLGAINGLALAFETLVTSSDKGSMFKITGSENADRFTITPLYPRSAATGREAVAYVGNDIHFGRQGRIESLIATDQFGDVEVDDLSRLISPDIEDYDEWIINYNSRLQRVYCLPPEKGELWVLQKQLLAGELSPWSRWVTTHPINFDPTAIMSCLDPDDGLEYVFFGDASGNVYRLEGTGTDGDGGTDAIRTNRTSGLFKAELNAEVYNVEGWVLARRGQAVGVRVQMLYAGERIFDADASVEIPAADISSVYGGTAYYGGTDYYEATFRGRLVRRKFTIPAGSTEFQVRVETNTDDDIEIIEIGLRFSEAA